MTMTVRPIVPVGLTVTAVRSHVPVTVRPVALPGLTVRVVFAGAPGRDGQSGLQADAPLDLAAWYQLQKET